MNPPSPARPAASPRITPADWDKLRREFHHSLLADTSLSALAENIDGCRWSAKDPDETPSAYIVLEHAEVVARLQSLGQSPASFDKLADILRGTLAFDESFGEMVDVAGKAEADLDPVTRNLERLGIPLDFPVVLCNFKPGTLEFCQREQIAVIADFLSFSRGASRSVIIGGEFRDLLNAITHIDELVIARHLPFRPKTSGLYLVEALAHLLRPLDPAQRRQLALAPETLAPAARTQADLLARHFSAQVDNMRAALADGTPLARLVAPLDEIELEACVASVLGLYLRAQAPADAPRVEKRGLFQRLFGRR